MKNARSTTLAILALTVALGLLDSLHGAHADSRNRSRFGRHSNDRTSFGPSLPVGSTILVAVRGPITTQTARTGDAWYGTVAGNVAGSNGRVIPAGSPVTGVISSSSAAQRSTRATLDLAVRSIRVNGREETVMANAGEIVAGSTRARNLGVVAGGAAAGAVVGNNVGDHNHTLLGAVIGGAAAAGAVSKTRGYQVELKDGTVMSFSVTQSVTMR